MLLAAIGGSGSHLLLINREYGGSLHLPSQLQKIIIIIIRWLPHLLLLRFKYLPLGMDMIYMMGAAIIYKKLKIIIQSQPLFGYYNAGRMSCMWSTLHANC